MARKKRVILNFAPTDKQIMIFQNMGWLDKRGRLTGGINFNDWLRRLVGKELNIEDSTQNLDLQARVLRSEIEAEQKAHAERNDKHEKRIRALAQKLHAVESQKTVVDYEGSDEGQGRCSTDKVYKPEELQP